VGRFSAAASLVDDDYQPLIPIQHGEKDRPPVFCIPGAGAGIAYFSPLARQLGGIAVYGFQPRGLDGEAPPLDSVEVMAKSYLHALTPFAAQAPLRLVGHSFGAWVALEMALRLRAAGRALDTLILLDAPPPATPDTPARRYDDLATIQKLVELLERASQRSLGLGAEQLAAAASDTRIDLLRQAMVARGIVSARTPINAIQAMVRVFAININTTYRPLSSYPSRTVLVRASNEDRCRSSSVECVATWQHFAPRLEVIDGPGNHMTMLSATHAAALARIVLPLWQTFS